MKIRPDHLMHLKGGVFTLIGSALIAEVQRRYGIPLAVAFGGIVFWAYVEGYQWARGNGKPEMLDAVFGALPSIVGGALLYWWLS